MGTGQKNTSPFCKALRLPFQLMLLAFASVLSKNTSGTNKDTSSSDNGAESGPRGQDGSVHSGVRS